MDAGKFDWKASGRFRDFTEPDPSYHGIVYTEAFGPLAFILKARVQGLRDTGARCRRSTPSCSCRARRRLHLRMERHSENALAVAKFLGAASWRRVGQLPRAAVEPVLPARAEVSARRAPGRW